LSLDASFDIAGFKIQQKIQLAVATMTFRMNVQKIHRDEAAMMSTKPEFQDSSRKKSCLFRALW